MILTRLREAGKIKRIRPEDAYHRNVTWEVGTEKGLSVPKSPDGSPRQLTVTTWEPETRCDPIVAMLFGRAE